MSVFPLLLANLNPGFYSAVDVSTLETMATFYPNFSVACTIMAVILHTRRIRDVSTLKFADKFFCSF